MSFIPDLKRESKTILSGSQIPPSMMALIPNRHSGIKTLLAVLEDQDFHCSPIWKTPSTWIFSDGWVAHKPFSGRGEPRRPSL